MALAHPWPTIYGAVRVVVFIAFSLLEESPQDGFDFFDELLLRHWLGAFVLALGAVPYDARGDMLGEQLDPDRIECGSDCCDLGKDVHAVAVFIHHALNPRHLSGDTVEARCQFFARVWSLVHRDSISVSV